MTFSSAEMMSAFDPPALRIIVLVERGRTGDDTSSSGVTGFDTMPV
jgi:hypothetical protein